MIEVNFNSLEIANAINGILVGKNEIIRSIMLDSREKSTENACFFAIKGEKFNGNSYVKEALKNGARLVVTEEKPSLDQISYILVENVIKAIGLLGKYNSKKTKIIAVTGSAGKTTTKEMIKYVLKEKYSVIATRSNENNEIGVAKTLLSIKDHDFCIVEMGMRAKGEIEYLANLCMPYISVITNCGSAHLQYLGSTEDIFKAKCEIIPYTQKYCIVPNEKRFKNLSYENPTMIFAGASGDYELFDQSFYNNGIKFKVRDNNHNIISGDLFCDAFGIYNTQNALNAYIIGQLCGLDEIHIKRGFFNFKGCDMRGKVSVINGITIIEDCYNCSYEGMKNAIFSLNEYSRENLKKPYILVGDMLEIGNDSEEYHFRIGEYAKDLGIKNVFSYGMFSKSILDGFCGGKEFKDKKDIAPHLLNVLGKDDVLLIKASRGAHFENIISEMKV